MVTNTAAAMAALTWMTVSWMRQQRPSVLGAAVATFFINGTKVRDLRGQAPKGGWRFGLSGDNFDKAKDARVVFREREGHRLSVGSAALAQQLRRLRSRNN